MRCGTELCLYYLNANSMEDSCGKMEKNQRDNYYYRALSAVWRECSMVSQFREVEFTEWNLHRWWGLFIKGGCERLSGVHSLAGSKFYCLNKEQSVRIQVISEQAITIRASKIWSLKWINPCPTKQWSEIDIIEFLNNKYILENRK